MVNTVIKKSWNDLSVRKSRSTFIIITIALAVSGFGLFAVMPLMDQAMNVEIENSNMYDLSLSFNNLELDDNELSAIEDLDNVKSVEGRYLFVTRIYIGERRNDAVFVGVEDFNDQAVDIIEIESGYSPGYMQVVTDTGNIRSDLYTAGIGDTVRAYNSTGQLVELSITGEGHTLRYDFAAYGVAVFYTDIATVHSMAEGAGYNQLTIDLVNSGNGAADSTAEDIQLYLTENTEFSAFTQLPRIREEGDWPGKDDLASLTSFFSILTFIAVFCSLFLISNTMHTMVTEQRKEIAQMKAVGATRKQVVQSYLTTSMIIGLIGSAAGIFLGVLFTFLIERFFMLSFYGISPVFLVHTQTLLLSICIGLGITVLATLPALYKALKITVREGMEGVSITHNGSSGLHKSMLKMGLMPRSAQMGIRNITRKKGRSVSTIIQISLAVGIFLAIISIGYTINVTIAEEFDNFDYDIMTIGQTNDGKPLKEYLKAELEDIEGVSAAEPFISTMAQYNDRNVGCFGYIHDTFAYQYEKTHYRGRWFNSAEQEANASVMVIGKALARLEGIGIGDKIPLELATGTHEFEIIGIDSGQMYNGYIAFIPLTTLQNIMMWNDTVTGFSIVTEGDSHKVIDRVSTQIEDDMLAKGYVVNNQIMYIIEEQNQRDIAQIMNLMIAVGSLVILITMIGLMSTLTMNVLERTKEIGMMRCLGSRSGHIRSMFGSEGLTLGLIGWAIGIPLGYSIGLYLNYMTYDLMHIEMTYLFPFNYVILSLMLTLVLSVVVIQPPLWRATHFKPGDALRYQ